MRILSVIVSASLLALGATGPAAAHHSQRPHGTVASTPSPHACWINSRWVSGLTDDQCNTISGQWLRPGTTVFACRFDEHWYFELGPQRCRAVGGEYGPARAGQ